MGEIGTSFDFVVESAKDLKACDIGHSSDPFIHITGPDSFDRVCKEKGERMRSEMESVKGRGGEGEDRERSGREEWLIT
jgi:hypothetical protein